MTTFQMAQRAYENPGKVFFGHSKANPNKKKVRWDGWGFMEIDDDSDPPVYLSLESLQKEEYFWEDAREPRTWNGEYDMKYDSKENSSYSGAWPEAKVLPGVRVHIKWEAEEIL